MGKVGKWARQTKWRFYVLQDRFLYYYAAQTDERPKGAIFLEGSLVKKVARSSTALELTLTNSAQRRELHCKTAAECATWVEHLARAARASAWHSSGSGQASIAKALEKVKADIFKAESSQTRAIDLAAFLDL